MTAKKTVKPTDEDTASESEGTSEMDKPADPMEDPLKWLDEGLPDLSGYNKHEFDLALQFDIQRYLDVLADSVSDFQKTSDKGGVQRKGPIQAMDTSADKLVPADEEWVEW